MMSKTGAPMLTVDAITIRLSGDLTKHLKPRL
jgi:hypothetical protein